MSFAETSATRETAATLPAGLRLGAVHLTVTELDRSVAFYHVALLFDSRRALAHAALRLVATRTPIQGASDHGVSEAIYLADVDGNGIERYADRPREQWPAPTAPGERGHPHPRPRLAAVDRHRRGPAAAAPRRRRTDPRPRPPPRRRPGRRAAFCVGLLGLESMSSLGSADFLAAGGYHHHLGINVWRGEGIPDAPAPDTVAGLRHWIVLPSAKQVDAIRTRGDRERPAGRR
jgi:catechol 2,3-dioxygenase